MTLKEAGLLWVASMVLIIWAYATYTNGKQRMYWIGRRDGWDMHRRMIDSKLKSDEVFDYDKN
jgi:membrane protein DedA with SNARE-associated domain